MILSDLIPFGLYQAEQQKQMELSHDHQDLVRQNVGCRLAV
jgi:hypothetical protein